MWQRFTERARKVVFYAQEEAQKFGQGYVSTEHLLLGLVRETDNLACCVIESLGISPIRVRSEIERQLPSADSHPTQDMTLTPRAKRVIDLAYEEAKNLNNNYIGTEHLLLGLCKEGDGLAGRVLSKLGLSLKALRQKVLEMQDGGHENPTLVQEKLMSMERHKPELFLGFLMGHCIRQHLMLTLIADEASITGRVIRAQCDDVSKLQWDLWGQVITAAKTGLTAPEHGALQRLLITAQQEAGDEKVEDHHLLLALLIEDGAGFGNTLRSSGITVERSRELIAEFGRSDV